jgi:regulator of sigma E protease
MGFLADPLFLVLAILALGVLIVVHEGGHYLVARLSGMRVDRFSIGFGPKLFSFKRGETLFQIAAIPLGGFVQIAGLNPGEEGIEPDDPRAYPNRPVYQRFLTIFAGPATNYLFAALVMVVVHLAWGVAESGKIPVVGALPADKPAARAGIEPGDEIVSINGKRTEDVDQVAPLVNASAGNPITVEVLRHKTNKTFTVTPLKDGNDWRIGIQLTTRAIHVKQPVGVAVVEAFRYPYDYSRFMLAQIGQAISSRSAKGFSGPIEIIRQMKQHLELGLLSALKVIAAISIALGLFNLLPLPALDGGRLVFLLWELISRRRVNQKIEQTIHMVGMVALLGFVIYISFSNDIRRLFKG